MLKAFGQFPEDIDCCDFGVHKNTRKMCSFQVIVWEDRSGLSLIPVFLTAPIQTS